MDTTGLINDCAREKKNIVQVCTGQKQTVSAYKLERFLSVSDFYGLNGQKRSYYGLRVVLSIACHF